MVRIAPGTKQQARSRNHGIEFIAAKLTNPANLGVCHRIGETPLGYAASNKAYGGVFAPQGAYVVNQRLKQLMKDLSEAINESLSEAEPIAQVIGKIKNEGYDVFLVLEATVGFNRHEEEEEEKESKPELVRGNKVTTAPPDLKVNQQDLRFLKSLRISLGEPKDVKDRAA
jgi:hypothetical protein